MDEVVAHLESLLDETMDPVRSLRDSAEAERSTLQERIKDLSSVISRCNRVIAASQPPQPPKPKKDEKAAARKQTLSDDKRREGEEWVSLWLKDHDDVSPVDLVRERGWSSPQASYLFRDLREENIIRLAGRGPGGRKLYRLMETADAA